MAMGCLTMIKWKTILHISYFELFPYGTNTISLQFRTAGIATITAGVVSNGGLPFENDDDVVSMQGNIIAERGYQ